MANIKQKITRIKTNEKARLRNSQLKSRVRTFIKKTKKAIINKEENLLKLINRTYKEIDKSVSKGIWKAGKAARIKSRIMKLYNKFNITHNKKEEIKETKKPNKDTTKKSATKKSATSKVKKEIK